MSAGISRVHGSAVLPSQRPSTLSFFNISLPNANVVSENTVVNGAFDQIFRTAASQFATVALIGTPQYTGGNTVLNFAIEDTGVLTTISTDTSYAASGLGFGSSEDSTYKYTTTALALQGYIRALGSSVGPNTVNLSTATVTAGVVASTSAFI